MIRNNVVFRCDGASHIGLGHVMRCLSLADGLRREGFAHITFMSKDYDECILNKIREYGFKVETIPHRADPDEDLRRLIEIARRSDYPVVITDSYDIDSHYLKALKNEGPFVVCIDDMAQIHFFSDIVLNQNIYALEMNYSVESYTKLLLGQKYVLLRGEFLKERCEKRKLLKKEARSILLTMGGGAINNQTPKVLKAFKDIAEEDDALTVYVVSGVGCQDKRQQYSLVSEKNLEVKVIHDPDNLVQLMAETDIAISGGGSTCYELAYLGVPNIIISLADNQKGIAEKLDAEGVSIYLGYYKDVEIKDIRESVETLIADSEKRREMSERGRKLIDGLGVDRVVREVKELIKDI